MANKITLPDLAASVVAQDDGIRNDLKGLVRDMIKHMRYTMRHGEPAAKTALSKQIIPQLLTAINKVDADEGEQEEREAYQRLMTALAGDAPTLLEKDTAPETTQDLPPVVDTPPHKAKKPVKKATKKTVKKTVKKVATKKRLAAKR